MVLGLGCRRLGRFEDTIRRNGAASQLGRSGDTRISWWHTACTRVQVITARDALRYHAMGVQVDHG